MHEFYLRYTKPKKELIGDEYAQRLSETSQAIRWRSALIWAEHCSECAMPSCFSSCEFYSPRMDLKCQRFEYGIVPVSSAAYLVPEAMSVQFKKWGKLEASGVATIVTPRNLSLLGMINTRLEAALRLLPMPYAVKLRLVGLCKRFLEKISSDGDNIGTGTSNEAVYFLIETVNRENTALSFSFTIREAERAQRVYQNLVTIPTGYHRTVIDINEMSSVSLDQKCLYQIEPSTTDVKTNVVFGTLDFVMIDSGLATALTSSASADTMATENANSQAAAKVKAVVWDLDNTLWDGTLVEDGVDKIRLRPEMVHRIVQLDEMGIVNSIASKNNSDDALAALKRFGLEQYFVYPQISWSPKSGSIKAIQRSLNIGMNTIVFIDDQVFERTEVVETLPEVRAFSDQDVAQLLERPEFQLPVTKESRKRRVMYQENRVREEAMEVSGGDYTSFLKSCNLELYLDNLDSQTIDRVHELSQRTNQMNFSGNRYTKTQLGEIIHDSTKRTYVISCSDRFGDYGIVGFAIIDDLAKRLIDLMFSCRIQAKRVEHTFVQHVLAHYKLRGAETFYASYRPTAKNAQSGKVFEDLGFVMSSETDGLQDLTFNLADLAEEDAVMSVADNTKLVDSDDR